MNQRNSFYRKVAYGAGMALLLFPLGYLGSPRTKQDEGGVLAKQRDQHELGQVDLGEIDPASETMKLATLGLKGVAVTRLWNQANYYKKTENWTKLTATLDQLAKLQPNFITFWKFQSWNQSYNLSVEFDDYRDRYYYVRRGIEFLEEGERFNQDNPQILWELGWFVGQKIGRSDEKVQYRRLFIADDEYHGDRPVTERDNWLVSKNWYLEGVEAADGKQRGIGRKSPIVYYSSPAKSQMNYAEAIEREGKFDKARAEWTKSEKEWREFGARDLVHSSGVRLRLGELQRVEQRLEETTQRLEGLAPEVLKKMRDDAMAELSEEQRDALKKSPEDRSQAEWPLARQAERALDFRARDIAKAIGAKQPDLRRQAAEIAAQIEQLDDLARKTRSYRQTANYDYWLTRSEFEQTDAAVEARQLIYLGRKAFREELDPDKAKDLYKRGLDNWRKVLDAYPALLEGDGATGDDVMIFISQYNEVLQQLDETLPDDFPLWDIVENFDNDRELVEELAEYKQRQQAKQQGGGKESEADAEDDDPGSGDPASDDPASDDPASDEADSAEPEAKESGSGDSDAEESDATESDSGSDAKDS